MPTRADETANVTTDLAYDSTSSDNASATAIQYRIHRAFSLRGGSAAIQHRQVTLTSTPHSRHNSPQHTKGRRSHKICTYRGSPEVAGRIGLFADLGPRRLTSDPVERPEL